MVANHHGRGMEKWGFLFEGDDPRHHGSTAIVAKVPSVPANSGLDTPPPAQEELFKWRGLRVHPLWGSVSPKTVDSGGVSVLYYIRSSPQIIKCSSLSRTSYGVGEGSRLELAASRE